MRTSRPDAAFRIDVLRSAGASTNLIDELLSPPTSRAAADASRAFPWPTSRMSQLAGLCADEVGADGAIEALKRHLVQLKFPIRDGISTDEAYLAATRRGSRRRAGRSRRE